MIPGRRPAWRQTGRAAATPTIHGFIVTSRCAMKRGAENVTARMWVGKTCGRRLRLDAQLANDARPGRDDRRPAGRRPAPSTMTARSQTEDRGVRAVRRRDLHFRGVELQMHDSRRVDGVDGGGQLAGDLDPLVLADRRVRAEGGQRPAGHILAGDDTAARRRSDRHPAACRRSDAGSGRGQAFQW